ncbi:MAG: sugar ABC transporter permease [Actinomycetota bacterium]|nr:sugar ABC transporter permease [Actinomycetota bacterium]
MSVTGTLRTVRGRALGATDAGRPLEPGRSHANWVHQRDRRGAWFVVPFVIAFILFTLVPVGYSIYTSLYNTRLIGGTVFSGFQNYTATFQAGDFWSGFIRVIIFGAIQIPIMLAIAFFFATMFDLGIAKWGGAFRTIFFIPFAVPAVVASVMWSFLLEPQFGPFTHFASVLGFQGTNFLGTNLIFPTLILIVIWEWTGYNMVILFTALKAVPREVIEAAVLDGASLAKVVLRVKLPLVRPAIVVLVFLNAIGALQLFTEPLILQAYAPQSISNNWTPTLYLYNTAIGGQQYNLAAAGAVIFGLVIVVLSLVSLISRRRRGEFA